MKIVVNKNRLTIDPRQFLRRAGYGAIHSKDTGQDSFVRCLTRDFYPRLHMYAQDLPDRIIFDVHLDQKQASYKGARMHNAEHEGPVVEGEIDRLKNLLRTAAAGGSDFGNSADGEDWEKNLSDNLAQESINKKIGHGKIEDGFRLPEKKSWWNFWKS